jgi:hypothetical protein
MCQLVLIQVLICESRLRLGGVVWNQWEMEFIGIEMCKEIPVSLSCERMRGKETRQMSHANCKSDETQILNAKK